MIYGAKFNGYWLQGTAMVRAKDKKEAAKLLQVKLKSMGLTNSKVQDWDIIEFKRRENILILSDGDY